MDKPAVRRVLGSDNILAWSSDLCIKPPVSQGEFCWHQDSTYSGLEPSDCLVTAWLALTPSTNNSGCLSVISGSQVESSKPEIFSLVELQFYFTLIG